ncbi:MAG: hypothetical protein HY867_01650 [Chloroflexi bacterium]|nr:hypothetical protein [Chloroflexota bacterium]
MATKPKQTIAQQLTAGHLLIKNSIADAEIATLVAAFGYTVEKLNAGLSLHETAVEAVEAQQNKAGAQRTATQAYDEAEKTAHDAYQALAKVARAVYKQDPATLTTLGLTGAMPKDTAGFLAAAYTLFDNAAPLETLSQYGYDELRLPVERAKIAAYDTANQNQELAKGAAQQATVEQDAALEALNEWTAQYRKIAKVALRGKKQLLEKIGIAARTSPTKAQIEGKAKAALTRANKKAGNG